MGTDLDENGNLTKETQQGVIPGENLDQVAEVTEIFERDKLLARAMSPLPLERQEAGSFGHSFQVWDEEVGLMDSPSGLTSASCTLLVPGEEVPTYKSYGLLMNAEESNITHIAEMDSGSRGNVVDGDFQANSSDIESLDQLATIVRRDKKRQMNEVNANFKRGSVKGLFTLKASAPNNKIDILLAQIHLKTTGLDLPIFIYDFQKGALDPWQPTTQEMEVLIENIKSQSSKIIYSRELHQIGYLPSNDSSTPGNL